MIRNRFFATKVRRLKDTKPNQWWNAVKRIAGMSTPCGFKTLCAQLQIPGTDSLSSHEIANMINDKYDNITNIINPRPVPGLDRSCFIYTEEITSQSTWS